MFRPKSDKIAAQRTAFTYHEPLKKDFSAGSPVINEVVLGTSVNKGKKKDGTVRPLPGKPRYG